MDCERKRREYDTPYARRRHLRYACCWHLTNVDVMAKRPRNGIGARHVVTEVPLDVFATYRCCHCKAERSVNLSIPTFSSEHGRWAK
jgi:hypothetical protein